MGCRYPHHICGEHDFTNNYVARADRIFDALHLKPPVSVNTVFNKVFSPGFLTTLYPIFLLRPHLNPLDTTSISSSNRVLRRVSMTSRGIRK